MATTKQNKHFVDTGKDKSSPAPSIALLPLVRLLARQAARETLAQSSHDEVPHVDENEDR